MLTLITTLELGELDDKPTTQRKNYPFNSFFKVGDDYFGCANDGLYELGGNDDNGTEIDAYYEFAVVDFGIPDEKRLRELYTYGQLEGNLFVTATPDEHEAKKQRQKIITPDPNGMHRIKTKMGEGPKGTFWRISIRNVDGSFFSINSHGILPIVINQGYDKY